MSTVWCGSTGAWYGVLSVVSNLSVLTNALLIAITSNFVGFEVYIRGGYDEFYTGFNAAGSPIVPLGEHAADQGLSGYANWSTTSFSVNVLVDGEAFPAYTAQSLEYFSDDGELAEIVANNANGNTALYLPFIDIQCVMNSTLNETYPSCSEGNLVQVKVVRYNETEDDLQWTFSAAGYERFYRNKECRDLVLGTGTDNTSPRDGSQGDCFLSTTTCR